MYHWQLSLPLGKEIDHLNKQMRSKNHSAPTFAELSKIFIHIESEFYNILIHTRKIRKGGALVPKNNRRAEDG